MGLSIQNNVSAFESKTKSYIHGITPATFLQLMNAEQKNCTLKVMSAGQTGYLYIRRGELLDAEIVGLSGEAAALEIVTWENAEIEMDGICQRNQVVIKRSLEYILIAAFQRKDEQLHLTGPAHQNSNKTFKKNPIINSAQMVKEFIEDRLPAGLARGPFGLDLDDDGFALSFQGEGDNRLKRHQRLIQDLFFKVAKGIPGRCHLQLWYGNNIASRRQFHRHLLLAFHLKDIADPLFFILIRIVDHRVRT